MVTAKGFKPLTFSSEVRRSIQLSPACRQAGTQRVLIKKHHCKLQWCFYGDREGIQTPNLLIRSETLYSVEPCLPAGRYAASSNKKNTIANYNGVFMVTAKGFKPLTFSSVVRRSIQLSYAAVRSKILFQLHFSNIFLCLLPLQLF